MTDPEPQLSAVEWHTEDAAGDRVHDVQRDFPHYRIWREVTGSRGPRYVARARQLGVTPHTVVTADLAELTASCGPKPSLRASWSRDPGLLSRLGHPEEM